MPYRLDRVPGPCEELGRENERLARHIERLKRALEPFVKFLPPVDARCHVGLCSQEECGHCSRILAGRAALKETP